MATSLVQYCSSCKLDCLSDLPRDVIICATPAKIRQWTCSDETTYQPRHVVGELISWNFNCALGSPIYCYQLSYTAEDVVVPLLIEDITGVFCKDCFTDWIEDIVACNQTGVVDD